MSTLQANTLQDSNIIFINGYYRYVNHADKLATTGFKDKDTLIIYTDFIAFHNSAITLMQQRYIRLYIILV